MRAGLLRYNITFAKPVIVRDDFGGNSIVYEKVIDTRANINYNSGNRANENGEIVWGHNLTFTVRLYHELSNDWIIRYDGKEYRILSIDKDILKQQITIIAELIND